MFMLGVEGDKMQTSAAGVCARWGLSRLSAVPSGRCVSPHRRRFPRPSREGLNASAPARSRCDGPRRFSAILRARQFNSSVKGGSMMTTTKSPIDGLPRIDRPRSTWTERAAFYLQRNWMWTTVVGYVFILAVLVGAFALITNIPGQDLSLKKVLACVLVALALTQLAIFACTSIESGVARPRMIRVALASATNAERALLHHGLIELSRSKWQDGPLTRGELFRLFKEARESVGDTARRKQKKLAAICEAQTDQLRAVADHQTENS